MKFNVSKECLDLDINLAIVIIKNMKNCIESIDFNIYKEQVLNKIKLTEKKEDIENNEILQGFWELHAKVGKTSKHDISSPENLLNMFLEKDYFPNINLIVDIYNLVSIKTKLALGAHNLDKIKGNVELRLTNGNENFWPIGYSKSKPISKGEYAYIDSSNDILCRMEVRQVEKTKVTEDTTSCMYIIQGNKNVNNNQIKEAVEMLINLTTKYCGGESEVIYKSY